MAIPPGTKFAAIPPSNSNVNKKSAQLNSEAPIYDISEFPGGGGGGCPITFVLKPTSCNTEGPEPICTVSEIPNTWLYSCRSDLGAFVNEYVSLENNGVGVTYPVGEEFVRNCWYVEVWDPIPTKLDDCAECCTLIPQPPTPE